MTDIKLSAWHIIQSQKIATPPKATLGLVWWCTPVVPVLERLRQKHSEFEAGQGYIGKDCL
jgi:hypothetical protein